jgi:hypothetical protein
MSRLTDELRLLETERDEAVKVGEECARTVVKLEEMVREGWGDGGLHTGEGGVGCGKGVGAGRGALPRSSKAVARSGAGVGGSGEVCPNVVRGVVRGSGRCVQRV